MKLKKCLVTFCILMGQSLNGSSGLDLLQDLQGRWVLLERGNKKGQIYFEISGTNISGYDGCNRFGGDLKKPGSLRSTQRDCGKSVPDFPIDLESPVRYFEKANLAGSTLCLGLDENGNAIIFIKQSE